jgi:hypothetical protein
MKASGSTRRLADRLPSFIALNIVRRHYGYGRRDLHPPDMRQRRASTATGQAQNPEGGER